MSILNIAQQDSTIFLNETKVFEKAGFFFIGPNSKQGLPVLYAIVNRYEWHRFVSHHHLAAH